MVVCAVICEPVSTCNSLLTGKLTGNFAFLGPQKPISLHETTVLQRLFTKFPMQINRENILKNREISDKNREICRVICDHATKELGGRQLPDGTFCRSNRGMGEPHYPAGSIRR